MTPLASHLETIIMKIKFTYQFAIISIILRCTLIVSANERTNPEMPLSTPSDGPQPGSCSANPMVVGLVLNSTETCPPHFYCPNTFRNDSRTRARICPVGADCFLTRVTGQTCEPQGKYEPIVCPAGYYCPTTDQKIVCPKGKFCPVRTIVPMECPIFSSCPEGTTKRRIFTGVFLCSMVDLALAGFYFYSRRKRAQDLASQSIQSEDKVVETPSPGADDENSKLLFKKFRRVFKDSARGVPTMTFEFENLRLKLGENGPVLLNGVTGKISAGKLVAVMGPSGAGKTTFMNVLMGKVERTSGDLKVNGNECEIHQFKQIIGYVPQEDIMLREMTVRETILHSARIRLPRSWPDSAVESFVDVVLRNLNLWHVRHTLIGDEFNRGISGGQRKRVNIGIELVAAPLALFLDEPTSGLDSSSALQVIDTLKKIAGLGVAVTTVIHQPRYEIFDKIDEVLLLVAGGETAYFGPTQDSIEYFKNLGYKFGQFQNPADILIDIVSGTAENGFRKYTNKELADLWRKVPHKDLGRKPHAAQRTAAIEEDEFSATNPHPNNDHYNMNQFDGIRSQSHPTSDYEEQRKAAPHTNFDFLKPKQGSKYLSAKPQNFQSSPIQGIKNGKISAPSSPSSSKALVDWNRSAPMQTNHSPSRSNEYHVPHEQPSSLNEYNRSNPGFYNSADALFSSPNSSPNQPSIERLNFRSANSSNNPWVADGFNNEKKTANNLSSPLISRSSADALNQARNHSTPERLRPRNAGSFTGLPSPEGHQMHHSANLQSPSSAATMNKFKNEAGSADGKLMVRTSSEAQAFYNSRGNQAMHSPLSPRVNKPPKSMNEDNSSSGTRSKSRHLGSRGQL